MFRPDFLLCLWHARGAVIQQFLTVVWNYQEYEHLQYEQVPSVLNSKGLLKSRCHNCDCSSAALWCGTENTWTFVDGLPGHALEGQELQQVAMVIWYTSWQNDTEQNVPQNTAFLEVFLCTTPTLGIQTCLFQNSLLPCRSFLSRAMLQRFTPLFGLLVIIKNHERFPSFPFFSLCRCLEAEAPGSNPKESLDLGHPAASREIL